MPRTTTMTVRLSGALSDFVAANVGENGAYENISEYVRDLIRRDKERSEHEAYERLKAELSLAFAAPDNTYRSISAVEVIARNQT
ncbi:MAG: addiction module antitoxin [Gammaproteobacteria bacterium]|nr:addiction module antitoxin [Gammaproteobacteria bacterium]MBU1656371.1 addiction module antitoxin [Gammaproteobacteria bacterium]MBU1962127.1 addiction module antitoxin [Gammaproteobacteria bacterium]